jgi:hypothetical protein
MTDADGMTRATWLLAYATLGLVATGIAGIIFVWIQLSRERTQKRVENLERQIDMFEGNRFLKIRAKLGTERLRGENLKEMDSNDPPAGVFELLDFFEHVALLARERNLSAFGVWHSFGPWIGATWSDFKEIVAIEQIYNKTTYCDFRWLVEKIKKIETKEGGDLLEYDQEDLEGHYIYERQLAQGDVLGARKRPKLKRRSKTISIAPPITPTKPN